MRRPLHRRAFTIIELMLALVLASIVLAAMVGVLSLLTSADAVSSKRVDEQTDLAVAQNLIRRVLVSLAAVEPMDPEAMRVAMRKLRGGGAEAEETDANAQRQAELDQEGMKPMAPPDIAPMFELYFTELGDGSAAPALECVVIDPPGALMPGVRAMTVDAFRAVPRGSTYQGAMLSRRISQSVRGRFEVAPTEDGRWALQWRCLEPPAEPVTLISGVSGLEWWVLPIDENRREWQQVISAKLAGEFPISVRLEIWTDSGQQLSWMFETEMQIITMRGPEPEISPIGNGAEDDENADESEDVDPGDEEERE